MPLGSGSGVPPPLSLSLSFEQAVNAALIITVAARARALLATFAKNLFCFIVIEIYLIKNDWCPIKINGLILLSVRPVVQPN